MIFHLSFGTRFLTRDDKCSFCVIIESTMIEKPWDILHRKSTLNCYYILCSLFCLLVGDVIQRDNGKGFP